MQISVEKLNNAECRFIISVPNEEMESEYRKQILEIAKKANLQGFRPGRVPIHIVQQRFGKEVRRDVLDTVMRKAVAEAIEKEKLRPLRSPRIEPKPGQGADSFEFIAYVEVYPTIEQVIFELKDIEKPIVEVTENDINRVVEQLKKQHTTWQEVSRGAQLKDRIVIDYYAIFEGKSDLENKVEKFPLELGSQVMIPGFEEGLLGAKAGETKTLSLHFPSDFQLTDKANKPVDFVINVDKVYEGTFPEFNKDFIEKLGMTSGKLDDLHAQIRSTLEQERDRLVNAKLKEQIFTHLIEKNTVDVPSSLIEQEARSIHDEMYSDEHDHSKHSPLEISQFSELAKKRLIVSLLLAELIKQHHLQADARLVEKRISDIASLYQDPADVIKWLSSGKKRQEIELQVLEDQLIHQLMDNMHVTNKEMSYVELKGVSI